MRSTKCSQLMLRSVKSALFLGIFFAVVSASAQAQSNSTACQTNAIYTLNGILTSDTGAYKNQLMLEHLVRPQLTEAENRATEFGYIVNESQGVLGFNDLLETLLLSVGLSYGEFFSALGGITAFPPSIQNFFNELAALPVWNADLLDPETRDRIIDRSRLTIQQGKRVVVVAHSQGNLYSKAAESLLTDNERQSWATVNVALPDTDVQAGSRTGYTTLNLDGVIFPIDNIARQSLLLPPPASPNVDDGYINPFGRVLNHGFVDAYLANDPSRTKIVQDTITTMRGLAVPPTSPCGGLSNRYVYVAQLANPGFDQPTGVAIDPLSHNIFVTDFLNNAIQASNVQAFNFNGGYLEQFLAGQGFGGIAIDPSSRNVVITNANPGTVLSGATIYSSEGVALNYIVHGVGGADFRTPLGVAIDPTSHKIVVTDWTTANVQIFDSTGGYLSKFGGTHGSGNGQFQGPYGVAIDPSSHNIVIADHFNNRVQIFDSAGVYLSQFGTFGTGDGQFIKPIGVAIDPASRNILVVDSVNSRVQIFSSEGIYLGQFGSHGVGDGQFSSAAFIAIDPISHNVVVLERGGRAQIFALQ